MSLEEIVWQLAVTGFVVWRAAPFLKACNAIPHEGQAARHDSFQSETVCAVSLFATLDTMVCAYLWLSSQVSLFVISGSAAMILIGMLLSGTRRICDRFVSAPAMAGNSEGLPGYDHHGTKSGSVGLRVRGGQWI